MYKKEALRQTLRERRRSIPSDKRDALTVHAISHLYDYLSAQTFTCCALYMPVHDEISPLAIASHVPNLSWALPITMSDTMQFVAWSPEMPMQPGAFGIMEPIDKQSVDPDCIITPLLGFDANGHRLGYGKGYYDRYFASEVGRQAQRIGLAFACQQVERLPNDAHDIPLHAVITEDGIITATSQL